MAARWRTWRNIDDVIRRRVAVEQYLFDCVDGKRSPPDAETCRLLALKLGTPSDLQTIQLPKRPEAVK